MTSLNATMLVPSRLCLMLAEDRVVPRWLGRVDARTGTPLLGLVVTTVLALALLLSGRVALALDTAVVQDLQTLTTTDLAFRIADQKPTSLELTLLWAIVGLAQYRKPQQALPHARYTGE